MCMGHLYARYCARFWESKYVFKNISTSKGLVLILELDKSIPETKNVKCYKGSMYYFTKALKPIWQSQRVYHNGGNF